MSIYENFYQCRRTHSLVQTTLHRKIIVVVVVVVVAMSLHFTVEQSDLDQHVLRFSNAYDETLVLSMILHLYILERCRI